MVQLRPYVIRQGDYVAKLAHRHGFDAAEVWQLPKNETLRRKRGSPDILYPGDILYIPERDQPGQSVRAGGEQRYRARVPSTTVSLQLLDDGQPIADQECEVVGVAAAVAGQPVVVKTDGDGRIELDVPVIVDEFEVYVPSLHTTYAVRVGHMDPTAEMLGVVKRLRNLGYLDDDDDDGDEPDEEGDFPDEDEDVAAAIAAFQHDRGMIITSVADGALLAALKKAHRS